MAVIASTRKAAVVRTDVAPPEGVVDIKDVALFPTDFQANAADREAILRLWAQHLGK